MEKEKTSVFSNSLIWFGAAVSIAEILTGTLVAPLGVGKGVAAVLIGHLIGCVLLYFAGLVGARTGKSAMESVGISFGRGGAAVFSVLNILQLVGWTAVMLVSGAAASAATGIGNEKLWCVIIGAMILVRVLLRFKSRNILNTISMTALFILSVVLCVVIYLSGDASVSFGEGTITFGAAVELSVAMPLSWLPLISDYTRSAAKPRAVCFASSAVYFFASCWMYFIGMSAAIYTGEGDVAAIMLKAGLGIAGLLIIILSTVTTTFLDVYSAGVSCQSISGKLREKPAAVAVCVVGTLLAIFTPAAQYENFLYLIGSVFAPMAAILITDFFILKKDSSAKKLDVEGIILWAVGFALYRVFMRIDTPVGNTLPVMLITGALCVAVNKVINKIKGSNNHV